MNKIYYFFILTLFLYMGCGIVTKSIYQNIDISYLLKFHRDLVVYAPNDSKVYYTVTGANEQFGGYVRDGVIKINIDASRSGYDHFSSWKFDSDVSEREMELLKKVQDKAELNISVNVVYNEKKYFSYESCIYGIGCGNQGRFSDFPIVKNVVDESNSEALGYTSNIIYSIYYKDLVFNLNDEIANDLKNNINNDNVILKDEIIGKTKAGKDIYQGPNGKYTINKNGKKVYLNKTKKSKVN